MDEANEMIKEKNGKTSQKPDASFQKTNPKKISLMNSKKIKKDKTSIHINTERKMTRIFKKNLEEVDSNCNLKDEKIVISEEKSCEHTIPSTNIEELKFKQIIKELWVQIKNENQKSDSQTHDPNELKGKLEKFVAKISFDFEQFKSVCNENLDFLTKGYGNMLSGLIYILSSSQTSFIYKSFFQQLHQKINDLDNQIRCFVYTNFLKPDVIITLFSL